jgi:hypothetical protein
MTRSSRPRLAIVLLALAASAAAAERLMVYPAEGQTDQQLADDRYACHLFAVEQSHFDPANPPPAIASGRITVRVPENEREGAAAKGAIAGAIAGAVAGSRDRDAVGRAVIGAAIGGAIGGAVEAQGEREARAGAEAEASERAKARAAARAELEAARSNYQRAMQACLEGRGYVVR